MRTNIHVDGSDSSCGYLKGTPNQRLDMAALCARLLPEDEINQAGDDEPLRVVRQEPGLTIGVIECAAAAGSGHAVVVVADGVPAHEQQPGAT
ncbi:hypothetical protein [Geodermatophilus sp. URMC 62]|uniref:hypothetical protein n=1 Tax=Geodermatophilus sp. URMC 62 TaxID=3423414 RepID=UPI00406D2358